MPTEPTVPDEAAAQPESMRRTFEFEDDDVYVIGSDPAFEATVRKISTAVFDEDESDDRCARCGRYFDA